MGLPGQRPYVIMKIRLERLKAVIDLKLYDVHEVMNRHDVGIGGVD